MASQDTSSRSKYFYKISVDAFRAWTTFLLLATILVGGFVGYRLLAQHLLEREASLAIQEADALSKRLRRERGIAAHQEKYETAAKELDQARVLYRNEDLEKALDKAERSRSLLNSIVDSMRDRSPSGEAQFITTRGGVEVRRGERGEWGSARSRMVLHAGDYIKTSSGGSAEVMMVDGTLFTVRPGTVVLVSRARRTSGGRIGRTIALESGWVNMSTADSASRVTTPKAEAEIQVRSEAVVSYDKDKGEGKFTAFHGALRVASKDGVTRELNELQQVVQTGERLSAPRKIPDAPGLIAPDDDLELYLDGDRVLELSWRPVKGARTYALQVSGNRLFVDNIIDVENRSKTEASIGLRGEGAFVWRVAAFDGDGEKGPWSTIHRFRVVASQRASTARTTSAEQQEQGR